MDSGRLLWQEALAETLNLKRGRLQVFRVSGASVQLIEYEFGFLHSLTCHCFPRLLLSDYYHHCYSYSLLYCCSCLLLLILLLPLLFSVSGLILPLLMQLLVFFSPQAVYIYIHVYIYMCVCMCIYIYTLFFEYVRRHICST